MPHPSPGRPVADREVGLGVYSPAMEELVSLASRVAAVDSTVQIVGESGVGKERLARFIHDASPRARGPFVPINCGALPDALFESELFGHARGAFTGAVHDRPGLFEAADRGTLLLDEVGEVPLALQVKLLRALQEHEIRRVGENHQRKFNVRVMAATNRNLAVDVKERRFRSDLFYRLNVVELAIPPLRDRPEDLRGLVDTILARVAGQMRRPIIGYAPDALEQMLRYPWPGNIRELENAIERACALARGRLVELAGLPAEVRTSQSLSIASEHVRPLREILSDVDGLLLKGEHPVAIRYGWRTCAFLWTWSGSTPMEASSRFSKACRPAAPAHVHCASLRERANSIAVLELRAGAARVLVIVVGTRVRSPADAGDQPH